MHPFPSRRIPVNKCRNDVKSILFLTHFYPPEMGGASARISGLSKWLVRFGNDVTVLTGFPNYPSGKIYPGYKRRLTQYEYMDGVRVIRTWIYASSYKSKFHRILNNFSFMISSIFTGLRLEGQFDVIVASSPPLFIGISGWMISKLRRVPWIFDIRDIWPDIAIETGLFEENHFLMRWGKRLAKFIYNRANHITPVTQKKVQRIITEGIDEKKITLVSNGVDLDVIQNPRPFNWQNFPEIQNKFVASYMGLIGIAQGVDSIVRIARLLKDNKDIHFLIVGDGVIREQLVDDVNKTGLTNITFIKSQPHDVIPSIMEVSDVALVPLISDNLLDAIPSKLMEAWACQKPVILIAGGEAAELVRTVKGGLVVENGNDNNVLKAFLHLSRMESLGSTVFGNSDHSAYWSTLQ
jgi:glycosyltransferase involved in cell wall biosynthesis